MDSDQRARNEAVVKQCYEAFGRGDLMGMLALCTDDVTFDVPGAAPISGSYTKAAFGHMVQQVMQISGGTFGEDVIDLLSSDERVLAVLEHCLERDGAPRKYMTSHLWTLKGGSVTEWRELPFDQRIFEQTWS